MNKKTILTGLLCLLIPTLPIHAEDPDVHFIGYISYSDDWGGDTDNHPMCGFYTFTRDTEGFEQKTQDDWQNLARNGGTFARGKMYAFYTAESWMKPDPKFYTYDATTWKQENVVSYGATANYAMADITYDYTREEIVAVAYSGKSGAGDGHLYSINSTTGALTEIASLKGYYVGVAADNKGTLWVLNEAGGLYRLQRNGRPTKVGDTGYKLQSDESTNSLCFDQRTGRLYWVASVYEDESLGTDKICRGLFEINTTTGAATLIRRFWSNEKITALAIPSPHTLDAPDDIQDLSFTPTVPGKLEGCISFTAPATTYGQQSVAGTTLTVSISVDGQALEPLTATAGEPFTHTVTLSKVGRHSISVELSDSEGRKSQVFSANNYFGFDTPATPQNVRLTFDRERKTASVTWDPVTTGLNGGQIDQANLRYLITRYSPGEREDVESELQSATFIETVERPMAYTRYGVIAYDAIRESGNGYSNYELIGSAQELPFVTGINNWTEFHQFVTIDANGDGFDDWSTPSWYFDSTYGAAFCYCTRSDNGQDDWLITPALQFEAGHYYQAIFQTYGYFGYPNHLVVASGQYAEAEALDNILLDLTYVQKMPSSTSFDPSEVYTAFALLQATENDRYIGFHNISQITGGNFYTDHMSIDNIYIREISQEEYEELCAVKTISANEQKKFRTYDLQGRALKHSDKDTGTVQGHNLYIQNGKKVLR